MEEEQQHSTTTEREEEDALIDGVKGMNVVTDKLKEEEEEDPTCSSTAVDEEEEEEAEVAVKEVLPKETEKDTRKDTVTTPIPNNSSTSASSGRVSVSQRAAWLKNDAFQKSSSPSATTTAAGGVTTNTPLPRKKMDVSAKTKWLESAFTAGGSKIMPTMNDKSSSEVRTNKVPSTTSHNNPMFSSAYKKQTQEVYYLDKSDDPMGWAYEVWFHKQLLPWSPKKME
jgi:hypothetical protein